MDQKTPNGFLVVLEIKEYLDWTGLPPNPLYKGVDRLPAAPIPGDPPLFAEEAEALDAYVFGDFKDFDTNLIPTYQKAVELLQMFERSPRQYEIIYCCGDEKDLEELSQQEFRIEALGYDVASVTGDCWSIVDDMPDSPWAEPFRTRLNAHGLFPNKEDAEQYLQEYQDRREPDWDAELRVVFVARVLPCQGV